MIRMKHANTSPRGSTHFGTILRPPLVYPACDVCAEHPDAIFKLLNASQDTEAVPNTVAAFTLQMHRDAAVQARKHSMLSASMQLTAVHCRAAKALQQHHCAP